MANDPSLWCIPLTNDCRLMAEWGVWWQAFGVLVTLVVGVVGIYKIRKELENLRIQRADLLVAQERAAGLKRIEFFLDQHRRLFDDKELFDVLKLIDNDAPALADEEMWDKKRKFLTFVEEIALLVRANQISKDVALYMFGYYASMARLGKNFRVGIDPSPVHWSLFFWFADEAAEFALRHSGGLGPDEKMIP